MPDANKENTINQLVGAAFGAAGQRCMALSTAIFVGESRDWLPELVERSKSLRVNAGNLISDSVNTNLLSISNGICSYAFGKNSWSMILPFITGNFTRMYP